MEGHTWFIPCGSMIAFLTRFICSEFTNIIQKLISVNMKKNIPLQDIASDISKIRGKEIIKANYEINEEMSFK